MINSDAVLEQANRLRLEGKPFALVTVVRCESPTSARPGAKAVVDAEGNIDGWIGGGCAQPAVVSTVRKALRDGEPRLIRVSPTRGGASEEGIVDFGMTCHSGGTLDIFIDPVVPRPVALIIGASPSAQALATLAQRAGFQVAAATPGATAEMFPDAVQLVDGLDVASLACGTPTFVVVATQGKRDEAGLEAALATGAPWIAFIASARKADKLRTYLKERGHDPARVDAIRSPAGVEIGAATYEEIAVSVLAGMVAARRLEGVGAPDTAAEAAGHERAAETGMAIDPVCGMSVERAHAEYRSEYQGQRYYFCCAGCQHSFEKSPERYVTMEASSG
jgi:xanthine dehydrogenase accessory factor